MAGRPSSRIDLQELSSDQTFRDRYVRSRMFGEYPVAVFTVPDIGSIPDGLALGEEVTASVDGSLEIHGGAFPISFEIQARDDGDELFIPGSRHLYVGPAGDPQTHRSVRCEH